LTNAFFPLSPVKVVQFGHVSSAARPTPKKYKSFIELV